MKYVHRPHLLLLKHPAAPSDITLAHAGSLEMLQELQSEAMLLGDFRSPVEGPLRRFCAKAKSVYATLGAWAADYFIVESCRRLVHRTVIGREDFWADADRRQLGEMLSGISTREGRHFADPDTVSPKVGCLLSFLKEHHHDAFSGIVFVQERVTAHALAAVIAHHPMTRDLFCCQACVGATQGAKNQNIWDGLGAADVQTTLRQFRDGRLNLVVATNVLEEGIDLTACNVVVCFDQPGNIKSFIQRRGRARQEKATFAILVSADCDSQTISQWRVLEEEMVRLYQDHERTIQDLEAVESHPEPVSYRLKLPTG